MDNMGDCNEYLRTLNMTPEEHWALNDGTLDLEEEERRFPKRRTPPGQPTVSDIVKPGDIVKTTYDTGPYRVEKVRVYKSYVGDPIFTLIVSNPNGRYKKDGRATKENLCWLNELVAVDGRLLAYFVNNDDEVIVVDSSQATGKQLDLI